MLKRTLFFQSPGHLHLADKQLCFTQRPNGAATPGPRRVPIEDTGFIVIENPQITITAALLQALAANNTVVVFCDEKHMPTSFFSAMTANSLAQKTIQAQLSVSEAQKKRLWKQTVAAKITNQAQVLQHYSCPQAKTLLRLAAAIKDGDPENTEGTAARFYFSAIAPHPEFTRTQTGGMPNAALNYGYAILRAAMARSLIGSGLLCLAGIHHHNQYNPFCLADDIMEPYRPFVDEEVFGDPVFCASDEITIPQKAKLLSVLVADVKIRGMKRPLQNAMSYTTASLVRCFFKEQKTIDYPEFCS